MKKDIRILVVDDEPMLRTLLISILRREGYSADEADNANEALSYLEQNKADIIMTDVRMPEMDGLELTRVVKTRFPQTGVIVMTGHGDSYSVKDALMAGADEYVTKPFKSYEIALVVERAYWRVLSATGQMTVEESEV